MTIEIVDFRIKSMVDLSIVFCKRLPGRVTNMFTGMFTGDLNLCSLVIFDVSKNKWGMKIWNKLNGHLFIS